VQFPAGQQSTGNVEMAQFDAHGKA